MLKKGEAITQENRLHDSLRSLEVGDGIYVATGSPLPNGEMKIDFFYSNNVPSLKISTLGMGRVLKVSFSSNENDNKELFHFLFSKTRANSPS